MHGLARPAAVSDLGLDLQERAPGGLDGRHAVDGRAGGTRCRRGRAAAAREGEVGHRPRTVRRRGRGCGGRRQHARDRREADGGPGPWPTNDDAGFRIEHDSMGEVRVPATARWGAQTQRAVENFPISGRPIDRRLIRALGLDQGRRRPTVNGRLQGRPEGDEAHRRGHRRGGRGGGRRRLHDDQFPIDVFQTGSGTSSNMNANEVHRLRWPSERLGRRPVHPNDHVNASQSSNDVFPSAIHLAAAEAVARRPAPRARAPRRRAAAQGDRSSRTVVKSGRTHLMDATPVTLGQEFGGYAAQVAQGIERPHRDTLPRVGELPARRHRRRAPASTRPKGFARGGHQAAGRAHWTCPLTEAPDHFAAQGARDALVETVGPAPDRRGRRCIKIANDLRWMALGPAHRAGRDPPARPPARLVDHARQGEPGACAEAVTQVAAQVIGNDAAVAFAGSQGNFELNVYLPVMARNLLESIELLANVSRAVRRPVRRRHRGRRGALPGLRRVVSPSIGTSLNPYLGYEKAAEVIKESLQTGRSIRELVRPRAKLMPGRARPGPRRPRPHQGRASPQGLSVGQRSVGSDRSGGRRGLGRGRLVPAWPPSCVPVGVLPGGHPGSSGADHRGLPACQRRLRGEQEDRQGGDEPEGPVPGRGSRRDRTPCPSPAPKRMVDATVRTAAVPASQPRHRRSAPGAGRSPAVLGPQEARRGEPGRHADERHDHQAHGEPAGWSTARTGRWPGATATRRRGPATGPGRRCRAAGRARPSRRAGRRATRPGSAAWSSDTSVDHVAVGTARLLGLLVVEEEPAGHEHGSRPAGAGAGRRRCCRSGATRRPAR